MATIYLTQPSKIEAIKTDKTLARLANAGKYEAYNKRINKLRTKYNLFITDGSQISAPLCSSTLKPLQ